MADGKIIIDTSVDNSGIDSGLKKIEEKANKGLSTLNKTFLALGTAVTGVGVAATKVGMNFEATMSKVSAISGATGDELDKLTDKAKQMGATTKFSASEAGEAFTYMAMAGWKTGDMLNGIEGIMNLAAASGENLGLVSDIVTDALTAFGLSASDSSHFADVLAAASSNANTNVAMMGETFKYVAPVAGSLGYSAEDTAVAIGLMGNAGIKASQAGTSLRQALLGLQGGVELATKSTDSWVIETANADGTMRDLNDVIVDLREAFSDMTAEQQAANAESIAGKVGMSGLLAIVNAAESDFDKLTNAVNNSNGVSKEMADTMNDNLQGSLTLLGSALEAAGIAFYEKFQGPAKEVVDDVANFFTDLTTNLSNGELDDELSLIASGLAAIGIGLLVFNVASVISNFIGVLNGTATAIGLVAKAQAIWNAITAMNPVGLIIAAVAGLVAGLVVLWNTNEGFRNAVIKAWNTIKETAINVWGGICTFFTVTIPNAWNSLVSWFQGIPGWFQGVLDSVLAVFKAWGTNIQLFFIETIPQVIQSVIDWFNQLPEKIGYALGYALGTIIQWGVDTWNYLVTNVPIWIENIVKFFSELPGKIWTWLVETFNKVTTWGSNMLNKAKETGTNFINNITNWVEQLPGKFSSWLNDTISKVASFASNLGQRASQAGQSMVNNIINVVKNLPSQMASIGKNIVEGVWNGITGMGSWLMGKVSSFFSGIVDGAKKALGIHSPSRVMRDQVGKYMAQGVGVGFEDETKNVQRSIEGDFEYLVAKMSATVDYETAMTTARVVAHNNVLSGGIEADNNAYKERPLILEAKLIVDGKEFTQEVVAPNQEVLSEYYEGR